jgi:methyltransferase
MDLSAVLYCILLLMVGILRIVELHVSNRNRQRLLALGVEDVADPHFHWMVIVHIAILIGAALEVILLNRYLVPVFAVFMTGLFLLANAVRWWVIRTLEIQWTVRVMNSARLGVVEDGPFAYVRHPNYAAVFIEMAALPLIHSAWLTAILGSAAHAWVLSRRLAVEEPALMANPLYSEKMAHKPRFFPFRPKGKHQQASFNP